MSQKISKKLSNILAARVGGFTAFGLRMKKLKRFKSFGFLERF